MRLQWTATGFKVVDEAKNTVSIGTEAWQGGGDPPSVSAGLEAVDTGPDEPALTVAGRTRALRLPPVVVTLFTIDGGGRRVFPPDGRLSLDDGSFVARVDAHVETRMFVRFDGPATLIADESSELEIRFPEVQGVSVGFTSRVGSPDETVVVPETPTGVAEAVTALSVANRTTTPDRTWPTQRDQPPRIDFGQVTHVPESIRDRRPETDVTLRLPDDLRYPFVAAPLAHYLGARVRIDSDTDPHLDLDGRVVPLPRFPEFQRRAAALLRRVFHLDCLARTAGSHGSELSIQHVVHELGIDPERLYDAPLAERVRTYLDAPYRAVAGEFPEWHLTMHVHPTYEHARTLPSLLDTLPQLFLPVSTELSKKEWLRLTVADGYEAAGVGSPEPDTGGGATTRVRRELSNVNLVKPRLGPGKTHGWMAEKVPVDVFKTFPEAYQNREKYFNDDGTELSVTAVVNDSGRSDLGLSDVAEAEMRDEHEEIVTQYERRSKQFDIDLTIRENVSTAELARIFEARNDLVHFIGHRDDRGLECVNGYFSASTIRESNAQTFFINACGSYPEGKSLVQNGSVAGGVTFESVTNDDAVRVGTAFARLIVNGFCVERALDYTRKQLMTPKDYAVVGDGTHVVTQSEDIVPIGKFVFQEGDDQFSLVLDQSTPWMTGAEARYSVDNEVHLQGTDPLYELSRDEVIDYLESEEGPVVFEEELYRPEEVIRRLRPD